MLAPQSARRSRRSPVTRTRDQRPSAAARGPGATLLLREMWDRIERDACATVASLGIEPARRRLRAEILATAPCAAEQEAIREAAETAARSVWPDACVAVEFVEDLG